MIDRCKILKLCKICKIKEIPLSLRTKIFTNAKAKSVNIKYQTNPKMNNPKTNICEVYTSTSSKLNIKLSNSDKKILRYLSFQQTSLNLLIIKSKNFSAIIRVGLHRLYFKIKAA